MAGEAIFIGYRRDDIADVAGRIFDAMAQRFGRQRVFKDVDNIPPGVDFGDYIKSVLPRCRVALILIGPTWLTIADKNGKRRLENKNDWVRIEIETALATPGLQVVPVLVNGAHMPEADDLPDSLKPLLHRNAAIIRRDPDFHVDATRLARAIRTSVRTGALDLSALGGGVFSEPGTARPTWIRGAIAILMALAAISTAMSWRVAQQSRPPATSGVETPAVDPGAEPEGEPAPEIPDAATPSTTPDQSARMATLEAMLAPVSLAGDTPSEEQLRDYEQNGSPYVFFDYDDATLRPEAQAALDQQARWLLNHPRARARVYGNADERESDDPVMLGARRARAVRNYLLGAGVPSTQVGSTTFGLYEPLANQHDEAAWAMNRRVETRLVSIAAPD